MDALTGADYRVYALNPLVVARCRDRHHVSGAKYGAAKPSCWLVRTDRHDHRLIVGDTWDTEVKVLARAHPNLVWSRNRHINALRSVTA